MNDKTTSTTPRTDAICFYVDYAHYNGQCVKSDFARELEREVVSLTEQLQEAQQWIDSEPDWKDKMMRIYQEKNQTILQLSARVAELTRACENMIGCQFGGDDECKGCGHTQCCAPNCEWHQLHKVLSKPTPPTDVFEKVKEALLESKYKLDSNTNTPVLTDDLIVERIDEALALLGIQRKD